jgi:SAM-dependent methyltransferase
MATIQDDFAGPESAGWLNLGRFARYRTAPRKPWFAMLPRDIGLFLKSARTDYRIARRRREAGNGAAFEAAYQESEDPWASASPRYRYQALKYDRLVALLPHKQFKHALDLGCGLGLLSQRLVPYADQVLGMDIAPTAIELARQRAKGLDNVAFEHGDVMNLPETLNGRFDLVVVADLLYYLSPLDESVLRSVVNRIAELLAPGGVCLLANHFFFAADPDSKVSRSIHRAFAACPRFAVTSEHRKAFFLATLLSQNPAPLAA